MFFFSCVYAEGQTIKRNYWFANDSKKGLEKVVEVLRSDTSIFHGQYLHFFQSGITKIEGEFTYNQPTGLWKYFYESGDLKQTILYQNDSIQYWKNYYENGVLKQEGRVKNYLKDSVWNYYYENGKVLKSGAYIDNLQNDIWSYFYEDGENKALAQYYMGSGTYTEFYYKGGVKMRGPVQENETNGIWTYYYENGKVKSKGFEQSGVKNGQWSYFYDNDTLASEGNYINGVKNGEWKFFHHNGVLSSEGILHEGLRDGYWKLFNNKGGFKADAILVNGTGSYKEYYHNNKLKVIGSLKSDKNHGTWKYYYEDGTLEAQAEFVDGVGKYTEFYQSGEVKMKGLVVDGKQVGTWELYDKDAAIIGYYKLIPVGEEDSELKKIEYPSHDENPPILMTSAEEVKKLQYVKKNKQRVSFTPFKHKYGESKGLIVGLNPVAFVAYQLPVSVEYFIQERIGHELRYTIKRTPFVVSDKKIGDSLLFQKGYALDFRQKFYTKFKAQRGMLYFAHEIRFSQDKMYVKANNLSQLNLLRENKVEYGITIGDRVLHDIKTGGVTLDFYVGISGAMVFQKWQVSEGVLPKYLAFERNKLELNPRMGFSLGYLF